MMCLRSAGFIGPLLSETVAQGKTEVVSDLFSKHRKGLLQAFDGG